MRISPPRPILSGGGPDPRQVADGIAALFRVADGKKLPVSGNKFPASDSASPSIVIRMDRDRLQTWWSAAE